MANAKLIRQTISDLYRSAEDYAQLKLGRSPVVVQDDARDLVSHVCDDWGVDAPLVEFLDLAQFEAQAGVDRDEGESLLGQCEYGDNPRIQLPMREYHSTWTVLHETAHHLCEASRTRVVGHGPLFRKVLLMLVDDHISPPAHELLLAEYRSVRRMIKEHKSVGGFFGLRGLLTAAKDYTLEMLAVERGGHPDCKT